MAPQSMPKRTDISSILVIGAGLAMACSLAAPAAAQTEDDDFQRNVFDTFHAGAWRARAALYSRDYAFGPEYRCRMETAGASLTQSRPNESGTMGAFWWLLEDLRQQRENLEIEWVRVGGHRFEATRLPWRLVAPTDNDIVLTFERPMFAVRRDESSEWLPFEYLTLDLLEAGSFEIGYRYAVDNENGNEHEGVRHDRRTIDLEGFAEVAQWCGRQLLRDRHDEQRVRELTR